MDIRERIIRTVSYFDLFDRPLARHEVFSFLFGDDVGVDEAGVAVAIDVLATENKIKIIDDFVFLADRDKELLSLWKERQIISARKWKRAKRWAKFFAALPSVCLVGVGNTLSYNNAKDESDIDFFIITKPGTIWRTRAFCAIFPALFNLRPRPGDSRDKICLSFFVTQNAVRMYDIPTPVPETGIDVYMHYWTRLMVPLFGDNRLVGEFFNVNRLVPKTVTRPPLFLRLLLLFVGFFPGNFLKKTQFSLFPKILRDGESKQNGSVVISDDILKFHVSDRRADIYEQWQKRVNSILNEAR